MQITMIGAGYVGLVSGICLAELGFDVILVDNNAERVAMLVAGKIPIYEPGLEDYMVKNQARLRYTTDLAGAVGSSQAVFIAVGTPEGEDGSADLQYVYEVARDIGRSLRHFTVVVDKSTVPVGTGREVTRIIREVNPQAEFAVASNP
ncbi:MAG: UDP-glucose/GDP-mannose dehydrogenase family protein, partial [Magnetococcales bacterium]|nr:UDP-glucose/GDP-mannose dehydrogenase family protein [Magnetococcales bacterium]